MHTAEAAAAAPAAAPTAALAAPGTFWQYFSNCSDPSSSDPSGLFQRLRNDATVYHKLRTKAIRNPNGKLLDSTQR